MTTFADYSKTTLVEYDGDTYEVPCNVLDVDTGKSTFFPFPEHPGKKVKAGKLELWLHPVFRNISWRGCGDPLFCISYKGKDYIVDQWTPWNTDAYRYILFPDKLKLRQLAGGPASAMKMKITQALVDKKIQYMSGDMVVNNSAAAYAQKYKTRNFQDKHISLLVEGNGTPVRTNEVFLRKVNQEVVNLMKAWRREKTRIKAREKKAQAKNLGITVKELNAQNKEIKKTKKAIKRTNDWVQEYSAPTIELKNELEWFIDVMAESKDFDRQTFNKFRRKMRSLSNKLRPLQYLDKVND